MGLPSTWSLVSSRPIWDASAGWQVEQTYKGLANESDIDSVVAEVSAGASRLSLDKQVRGLDDAGSEYAYVVTLTVSYAADGPTGDAKPPGDPEYGLFSRTWELRFDTAYINLTASPQAERLSAVAADWPAVIEQIASEYRRQLRAWQESFLADQAAPKPDVEPYRAIAAYPSIVAPAGYDTLARWMFDKLVADPDATTMTQSPTLSKVEVVSAVSAVRASHANALRVFRYNSLVAAENSIEAAGLLGTADLYEQCPYWLKNRPAVEVTNQGRFQISQQYTGLAAYDGIQYGEAL